METVDFRAFEKLLFVAATILEVAPFERAKKPSYKVKLNCGKYVLNPLLLKLQIILFRN